MSDVQTEALGLIAEQQQLVLRMIERNGFAFEEIGNEPGNWQHLAFTLYSRICEIDVIARAALEEAEHDALQATVRAEAS